MKVVITGISRGIGKATAEKFLEEGWEVFGSSTSGKDNTKNPNLHVYMLDLADSKSIEQFANQIIEDAKNIDVLINNAGMQLGEESLDAEDLRKTLEVNLVGPAHLTIKLIPYINQGGHIIFLSSNLGALNNNFGTYEPSYSISKTAINKLTQVLADELRDENITVSSVDPGWVRTDMGGEEAPRNPKEPSNEIYKMATSKIDSGFFWHQNRKRTW